MCIRDSYLSVIKNYLNPAFGSKCMRDLTPLTLQQYFSGIASSKLSYESRDKIRDVMSSILSSAITYGILIKNPMEGVRLAPARKGNRIKPYIDPLKFYALLALIPEPYALSLIHICCLGTPSIGSLRHIPEGVGSATKWQHL